MSKKTGYLGNTNLKSINVPMEWTPEQIEEFAKCYRDPVYFAENYIKIVNLDEGFVNIKLYDYQRDIIEKFQTSNKIILGQSRQSGKTTTAVCIIAHYILFNRYKSVAILANKGDTAREIMDRLKMAYEALPKWMQSGIVEWNKGSIELENGCKVIAAATSSSAIRGKSQNIVYIDECGFVENWHEFAASVLPTISSSKNSKIIISSTPNGLNAFYKLYTNAKEGRNGYDWFEVPWWKVPGRDEEWKKRVLQDLDGDIDKFNQEYCMEFMGSAGTLISGAKLKQLVYQNPIYSTPDGISVYENPKEGNIYTCVVDVARGKGGDYSAFTVIDVTEMPYKQVFTYRSNLVTPVEYAEIVGVIAKKYNEAYTLIEINDIGAQVSDLLHFEHELESLIYTVNRGRGGKAISNGFGNTGAISDRGIRTTSVVKSVGTSMLKLIIEQDQLIINDFNTINELSTFIKKGNSYEAEPGKHDDLAMCLVLFSWLLTQNSFKELTSLDALSHLRNRSQEDIYTDLVPIGFSVDGEGNLESICR